MERRLLRFKQVQQMVPLGKTSLYAMMARGEFPMPMKLGPKLGPKTRASFWDSRELDAWIAGHLSKR